MNILHIISGGDTGGAKTHLLTLLSQMNRAEKDVRITLLCLMDGPFARDMRAAGIEVDLIIQKTRYDLASVWRIVKYVKANGFDVLHFHGARANFVAILLRPFLSGQVFCTTVHSDYLLDFVDSKYKQALYMPINKFALKRFKRLLAVTANMKETLVSRGFDEKKIDVVYNGIDANMDCPAVPKAAFLARYGLPDEAGILYIGIAARLQQVKGIDIFLRACLIASKELPHARFLIAGTGSEQDKYEAYVRENGLQDKVFFLGFVQDIFSFYQAIDINCLSSLSETFTFALLEGGLMAKATVSAACGGIPEMIEHGRTGLLFPIGDAEGMAKAVCRLAADEAERKRLGANFRTDVMEKFSAASMAALHTELYRKYLAPRRGKAKGGIGKVLIVGYHGYGNSGDEAILLAMKNNMLKLYPEAEIAALSHKPIDTELLYGINAVQRFSIPALLGAIRRHDVIVVGGGTLIQDGTSARSLVYYLGVIWLAKALGKKVMLYANGVGPVTRKMGRFLTKKIVNRVDLVTLREALSYDELRAYGVTKPQTVVTADPVFTMEGVAREAALAALQEEGVPTDKPIVGVSVREWKKSVAFTKKLAALCDFAAGKYNVTVLLIPMQYPQDLTISGDMIGMMKNPAYMLKKKWRPEALLGIMGLMECVISMRLHALIYAAVQGVPMLGIVYDPKIQYYLKALEMPCAGDVREDALDLEQMQKQLASLMENRAEYACALAEKAAVLRGKGFENDRLLVELMTDKTKRGK